MNKATYYKLEDFSIEIAVWFNEVTEEYQAQAYSTVDGRVLSEATGITHNRAYKRLEEKLITEYHLNPR